MEVEGKGKGHKETSMNSIFRVWKKPAIDLKRMEQRKVEIKEQGICELQRRGGV